MDRYIPQGAIRVADKHSSAVAYVYTNRRGQPSAIAFRGRADKCDWHFAFRSEADRERRVRNHFTAQQMTEKRAAERRAERAAFRHSYRPGAIFQSMWGYDQTNINYFEVTELRGETMLIVREIAQDREATAWEQGKCVPLPGQYIGEPQRVRAGNGHIRVGHHYASYQEPKMVGGVPTYSAGHWTSYA